jgi:hypothetical protein
MSLVFPALIPFGEYGGVFSAYFDAVYSVFHNDFIKSQPIYEGIKVSVRKYPEVDGMHRTFYHITHTLKALEMYIAQECGIRIK